MACGKYCVNFKIIAMKPIDIEDDALQHVCRVGTLDGMIMREN